MELNALQKTITRRKRRLGLGHGSGRVKTSGRGTKGQKARGKIPTRFEGGNLSIVKRLPFLRGKSRNKAFYPKPFNINLEALATLPKGTEVTKEVLLKHGLIKREDVIKRDVKILGKGEIQTPLTVVLQCSKEAVRKIEEAGGTVSHV